ncbi:MAG: DNA repair protein RadA [Chlamydiales bacterium]|nr:DNA repair protein RadA [Chlamydiales bacterium]
MAKEKSFWSCGECGHSQAKWTGSCSMCHKWNTFVQEVEIVDQKRRFEAEGKQPAKPVRLKEIEKVSFQRIQTRLSEFDRLIGGGIVRGSLSLIGGDPGIGKSTLMLQISQALASQGLIVLYVCGEESVEQTSLRAERLKIASENLFLLNETLFSNIKSHIEKLKPDILIVDSIQILYKSELPSAPGSIPQVREITTELLHLSKGLGISTFLIGHITKSGEIAGPKVLEHLVDTVLYFEGERHQGYRLLRSVKNRFGPSEEIAIFQMVGQGLKEVSNPSALFLQERTREVPGSAIVPTVEGTRALLIEVQALVAASAFATSTRKSSGLDQNRLALLLAVLEKRQGYNLHHSDVFVSVAGGMRVLEPAADLGIIMAICSSFSNRPIDQETLVIGEVGLGGEVRGVPRIEVRVKEAIHMGFRYCILPKRNLKEISHDLLQKISIKSVEFVEEATDVLIGK